MKTTNVKPASGKLGVLCVGMGAVTSTVIIGSLLVRKGLARPIGSFSQMGKMKAQKEDVEFRHVSEIVPIAKLNDIVFGGWDIFTDNIYQAATNAEVLKPAHINAVKDELEAIRPMKALFDPDYAKNIHGPNVKEGKNRWDLTEQVRQDIRNFKAQNHCDRIVVIWIASTEKFTPRDDKVHGSLAALEQAMKDDNKAQVAPSMCYAYAALSEGCPFIMGAPNVCVDIPAMWELAEKTKMPITGKDFKSGQTMIKSVIAPALITRQLGLTGWFSTNILGNRDGLVLDAPENFETKRRSKLTPVEDILDKQLYPELYSDIYHKICINYYPPRGDNKESWDNIDIFGWLDYPMAIKINFECRDSILAAPLALDLILFSDLAARAGRYGVQDFLSFYMKAPMHYDGKKAVVDLFKQFMVLKNALREMGGYEAYQEID